MSATSLLRSGCKVNLDLHITGRRPDGYHELDTLFLPLPEPHDEMHITRREGTGLTLHCTEPGIDTRHNTLTKAYTLYAETSGFAPGLDITLVKGVPHGAGLGGGSADAAALLAYLDELAPAPMGRDELVTIAARIGADVPFFLYDGPCSATGIGERLTPTANPYAGFTLVLACPDVQVSTAWAYRAWDTQHETRQKTRACLTTESLPDRTSFSRESWLHNSFERAVYMTFPELRSLKETLLRQRAAAALMSGSGASVFALYRDKVDADAAVELLRSQGIRVYQHIL